MERAISASEANQHFSELLRDVVAGQSFTVMSRGRPVARLLPVDRRLQGKSILRLLKFVDKLPRRHSGDWERDDLYR